MENTWEEQVLEQNHEFYSWFKQYIQEVSGEHMGVDRGVRSLREGKDWGDAFGHLQHADFS